MTEHLGHEKNRVAEGRESTNLRNGTRAKTVLTHATGAVELQVPRDRDGTFEPVIVRKRQRRLSEVDEIVLSLYARGLRTGEISAHFAQKKGGSRQRADRADGPRNPTTPHPPALDPSPRTRPHSAALYLAPPTSIPSPSMPLPGTQPTTISAAVVLDQRLNLDPPTLPRVATVSLAALIPEIGPLLERCDHPEQVAAMCGAAPVTKASGKSRTVRFRYTANKQARIAITSFADNSRHSSAWAEDAYRRARARGARHPHAVRILARG